MDCTDYLQKIQDNLAGHLGLAIALFGPEGNKITQTSHSSRFCRFIAAKHPEKCRQIRGGFFERVGRTRAGEVHQCFAGLCTYIEPLYRREKLLGYLKIGPFFKESFHKEPFLQESSCTGALTQGCSPLLFSLPGSREELTGLLEEVPVMEMGQFEEKLRLVHELYLPAVEAVLDRPASFPALSRELVRFHLQVLGREADGDPLEEGVGLAMRLPWVDLVFINLFNLRQRRLELVKAKGKVQYLRDKALLLGEGFSGWTALEEKPLLVPDLKQDYRLWGSQLLPDAPFNFLACFPLKDGEKILGTLTLCSGARDWITEEEYAFLELLAQSCAAAVTVKEYRLKSEVGAKAFRAFSELGRVLNSYLDIKGVLNMIVDMAGSLLNISCCGVYLLNNETGAPELKVARGAEPGHIELLKSRSGQAGKLPQGRDKDLRDYPLQVNDRLIGFLTILPESTDSFIAGEVGFDGEELITTFANLAAVAIENSRMFRQKEQVLNGIIRAFMMALEARDIFAAGHSRKTGDLAFDLAQKLKLSGPEAENLRLAGYLHDIGKVGIPEEILNKPAKLTPEDFETVKRHASLGAEMVAAIPEFKELAPLVLYHHENFDGTGYPYGLAGEAIPLGARILRIADAFEAMTSPRPYHVKRTLDEAYEALVENKGAQFDPLLVDLFGSVVEELKPKTSYTFNDFETDGEPASLPSSVNIDLTPRELEILALIARGHNNKEISRRLYISEKTVKTHITNILKKLSLPDRTKAAIYALQQGLIS